MSGERTYPVERHHFMRQTQRDFDRKIGANQRDGQRAFERADYRPFAGFSREGFNNLFAMGCELAPASQDEIIDRVSSPLLNIASELGIEGIFAGTGERPDLKPHITLFNAKFDGMAPEDKEAITQHLLSDYSHFGMIGKVFPGLSFEMDTLVVAPVSYVASREFNASQGAPYRTRMMAEEILERAIAAREKETGQTVEGTLDFPYRWNDILHATVGRLTAPASPEALREFAARANKEIGEPLRESPIRVTVAGVRIGKAGDIISEENPSLII